MITYNQLQNLVFWPVHLSGGSSKLASQSKIVLQTLDEILGEFVLDFPMTGRELQRFCFNGCLITVDNVFVANKTEPVEIAVKRPEFNALINTERTVVTAEERLARLEKQLLKQQRQSMAQMRVSTDNVEVVESQTDQVPEQPPLASEPPAATAAGKHASKNAPTTEGLRTEEPEGDQAVE